jgi:hypothetical protein
VGVVDDRAREFEELENEVSRHPFSVLPLSEIEQFRGRLINCWPTSENVEFCDRRDLLKYTLDSEIQERYTREAERRASLRYQVTTILVASGILVTIIIAVVG